jgi:uncharacterized membrane protein YhaH (DUF805 family)
MRYYVRAFQKYAVFSGRASRSEFWYFILVNGIIWLLLTVIAGTPGRTGAFWQVFQGTQFAATHAPVQAYSAFSLLPQIALSVRRFHDVGLTGWWIVLALVTDLLVFFNRLPGLSFLLGPAVVIMAVLIVLWSQPSQRGPNGFGPNPKSANPEVALAHAEGSPD